MTGDTDCHGRKLPRNDRGVDCRVTALLEMTEKCKKYVIAKAVRPVAIRIFAAGSGAVRKHRRGTDSHARFAGSE